MFLRRVRSLEAAVTTEDREAGFGAANLVANDPEAGFCAALLARGVLHNELKANATARAQ
jgi:hypothetical protein